MAKTVTMPGGYRPSTGQGVVTGEVTFSVVFLVIERSSAETSSTSFKLGGFNLEI